MSARAGGNLSHTAASQLLGLCSGCWSLERPQWVRQSVRLERGYQRQGSAPAERLQASRFRPELLGGRGSGAGESARA